MISRPPAGSGSMRLTSAVGAAAVMNPPAWSNTGAFRRVLFNTDMLANITTLVLILLAVARFKEHLPQGQRVQDLYFGPRNILFSCYSTIALYASGAVIALLLLTLQTELYFRHRMAICLVLRLTRLTIQLTTAFTPAAAATLATSVADRVASNPQKAAAMLVLQPTVFYMQSALILLPWQYMILFQAVSCSAMLRYMWVFPCHLQQLLQPGDSSSYPWQADADAACSTLQSYAALVAGAVGVPESSFSDTVCQGTSSMQALQVFGTLVCLFVLPVLGSCELQHWLCRQQRPVVHPSITGSNASSSSGEAPSNSSAAVGSRGGESLSSSYGSSSGSSTAGVASSSLRAGLQSGGSSRGMQLDDPMRRLAVAAAAADRSSHFWHLCSTCVVVLLLLPMLWLLSECVAQLFGANRDCAAVLAAAGAS